MDWITDTTGIEAATQGRLQDSGVQLTGRYLTEARGRRTIDQALWQAILDAVAAEPSVELTYPTTRTFLRGPIEISEQPPEAVDSADGPA